MGATSLFIAHTNFLPFFACRHSRHWLYLEKILQTIRLDAVLAFILHNNFTKRQKSLMQHRKWRVRKKWQNEYRLTQTKFITQKVEKGIKKVQKNNGDLLALYKS